MKFNKPHDDISMRLGSRYKLTHKSTFVRYGFSLLGSLICLAFQYILNGYIIESPYIFIYPFVFLTISVAGTGPAIASIFFCALGTNFLFIEPINSLHITDGSTIIRFIIFIITVGLTSWIINKNQEEENKIANFLGILDQEKKVANTIKQSEEKFKTIFNTMHDIAWTATPKGIIDFYNDKWFSFTDTNPTEYTQIKDWKDLLHEKDVVEFYKQWDIAFKNNHEFKMEFRLRGSDSKHKWFLGQIMPILDSAGRIKEWFGIFTDINERKKAEEILKKSGEELKRITEALPQAIWRANLDGTADYFSKSFYDIVGYASEDCLGAGWVNIIHPEDIQTAIVEFHRAIQAKEPLSITFRVKGKDGDWHWFHSMGKPFNDERGEIIKYYGTWTNIDDQKQHEEEINEALKTRDEFLSIASHELKTPLTSLKLHAQLFKRAIDKNDLSIYEKEKVDNFTDQTNKQITRLTALIDDILDISRIQKGMLSIDKVPMNLCEAVEDVVARMNVQFQTSKMPLPKVTLCERTDGEWDRLRIEQVITNLLTNAIRYGNGNPIEIRVENLPSKARVCVRDEGVGLAKENLERIFNRFERVENSCGQNGLGLGLFISQKIIEAHGGKIWAESELGNGSTFFVDLPKYLLEHENEELDE